MTEKELILMVHLMPNNVLKVDKIIGFTHYRWSYNFIAASCSQCEELGWFRKRSECLIFFSECTILHLPVDGVEHKNNASHGVISLLLECAEWSSLKENFKKEEKIGHKLNFSQLAITLEEMPFFLALKWIMGFTRCISMPVNIDTSSGLYCQTSTLRHFETRGM